MTLLELIPRGSIFLPQHGLKTGDVVNYELNGVNGSETAPKVKFFSATPTVDTTVGIGTSLFVIRKTDNLNRIINCQSWNRINWC